MDITDPDRPPKEDVQPVADWVPEVPKSAWARYEDDVREHPKPPHVDSHFAEPESRWTTHKCMLTGFVLGAVAVFFIWTIYALVISK